MKVSETGEFRLIELIQGTITKDNTSSLNPDSNLLIGIGDDCAAWKSRGYIQLSTTDSLVQDIHFDFTYTNWSDLGYKSLAVNLSDIAAMGGTPQYALISLGIPPDTEVANILELYRGIIEVANKYNVVIIGGNISAAYKLVINITVHGYTTDNRILSRSSAKPGEKIAVTGTIGLSAAGLYILKNKLKFRSEYASLYTNAQLRPEPRINEGQILIQHGVKTAIDISDGLLADLGHICKASNVSAVIQENLIPVEPSLIKDFKDEYIKLALTGGEDYQLLFTARAEIIQQIKSKISYPITVIGDILEKVDIPVRVIDSNENDMILSDQGWNHFK